jgi:hypothetical protein
MVDRRPARVVRILELLGVIGIIGLTLLLTWRFFRGGTASVGDEAPVADVSRPNLRGLRLEIPDRPHFIPDLLQDPKSIGRWHEFTVDTNSEGLRGPEFSVQKPRGVYRIACVGECVTFGNGVEGDETYSSQLLPLLNARYPGRTIEVINGGQLGLRPGEIVDRLESKFVRYSPDLVVLAPGAETEFLPEHTGGRQARVQLSEEEYTRAIQSFSSRMEHAVALGGLHGFDLMFVTPTMNTFFYPDGIRWSHELVAVGDRRGVPVVDTTTMFREAERLEGLVLELAGGRQKLVQHSGGEGRTLLEVDFDDQNNSRFVAPEIYAYLDDHPEVRPRMSIDENHPNATGHELIARAIHDEIVGMGWLEGGGD